ncbi:unnamed protein product [Parascedosporium putredinis]|uniref:alpha-1,2-Mannosidase n=1 Tax=Parascedosporium putredinis TaxID=1442378 RepID=A0A9P1H969_9PEZI|nr:unnamed protein product [Parascedosporium putredinis]CAI8002824.1 unnamed protein product [Parascedosporium putredinis]
MSSPRSRSRTRFILLAVFTTLFLYYHLSAPTTPASHIPYTASLALATSPSPPSVSSAKSPSRTLPTAAPSSSTPAGRAKPLPRIQYDFPSPSQHWSRDALKVRETRQRKVRTLFLKNWNAYRTHAWKKDALLPLSAGGRDQFSGWAATLVDSLDTLWVMGLRKEFDEAVAAVADIDFGVSTSTRVNVFETTVRYLGGLLAAYDLSRRAILLTKAVELADLLYVAFDTENRLPVDNIDFERAKLGRGLLAEGLVASAAPASLSLEMTRLSQLTGDPKYYDAVARVTRLFAAQQMDTDLPGMWPTRPLYERMSRAFLRTATTHLFFRPMLPSGHNVLFSGTVNVVAGSDPDSNGSDNTDKELSTESEHLACFAGGMMALASRLLSNATYLDTGARLAKGCAYAYKVFPTGLMPERFDLVPCPGDLLAPATCPWDRAAWNAAKTQYPARKANLPRGFASAKDPRYLLRPEAIESLFVLYRVTGDELYVEAAWDMFVAVSEATATEIANAAVLDVTVAKTAKKEVPKEDYMELLASRDPQILLPHLLTPDLISLDDFVLNTEAHPLRRPK